MGDRTQLRKKSEILSAECFCILSSEVLEFLWTVSI